MGTLKGFALPFGPPTRHHPPLASPFGDFGTCTFPPHPLAALAPRARPRHALRDGTPPATRAREARGGWGGLSVRSPRRGSRRAPHAAVLVATFVICGLTATARAEDERPGVFTYAYQGLVVGGGTGLAAGYLVAREGGLHSSDWKPMVYGVGIGALVGSGIGLTLGIVDATNNQPGRTHYILRDMAYGVGFGATVGAIAGGLAAISTKKPEHILLRRIHRHAFRRRFGLRGGISRGRTCTPATANSIPTTSVIGSVSVMPVVAGGRQSLPTFRLSPARY